MKASFASCRVWVGDAEVTAHLFVCTLFYSRRLYPEAFPHERLGAVFEGHEHAFRHFGGVPARVVVDNARPVVLRHDRDAETGRHRVVWHSTYADFAARL